MKTNRFVCVTDTKKENQVNCTIGMKNESKSS